PIAPITGSELRDHRLLIASGNGNPKKAWGGPAECVINIAIGPFDGGESTVARNLHFGAAIRPYFPNLERSAAFGSEIDRLTVAAPIGDDIFGSLAGEAPRGAAFGADEIDVGLAVGTRVERDPTAIGRPARRSGQWPIEVRQLCGIAAIAVA